MNNGQLCMDEVERKDLIRRIRDIELVITGADHERLKALRKEAEERAFLLNKLKEFEAETRERLGFNSGPPSFRGWAIVELVSGQRIAGLVVAPLPFLREMIQVEEAARTIALHPCDFMTTRAPGERAAKIKQIIGESRDDSIGAAEMDYLEPDYSE